MTRITYAKKEASQANPSKKGSPLGEEDEILHLKRLLVTLKQQYEKNLFYLNSQWQLEMANRQALQQELEKARKFHEEEQAALKLQQTTLKELLNNSRHELKLLREQLQGGHQEQLFAKQERLGQLEEMVPHLREDAKDAHAEAEHLKAKLEKITKQFEQILQEKEALLHDSRQQCLSFQDKIERLSGLALVQDRYESLKEDFVHVREQLEEALEGRIKTEHELIRMTAQMRAQEERLSDLHHQLAQLNQEKQLLLEETESLKGQLGESETRLKISQQHLAKKVKEAALLNEKAEELQAAVNEHHHQLDINQSDIHQLHASLEICQRQEKKLQDQLHEALRSAENQAAKWEEKYFKMYDKWEESEINIRELKKFEEKHHQMQSLLANLGSFMESPFHPSLINANIDSMEKPQSEPSAEEKHDLFAAKHLQEKFKSNLFP